MSWAEIKKAVNSDLSEPLNEKLADTEAELKEQFGLEFVNEYGGNNTDIEFSVTGFNGVLFLYDCGTSAISSSQGYKIMPSQTSTYQYSTEYGDVFVLRKDEISKFRVRGYRACVYAFGGGI